MAKIVQLSDALSNMIAAGEVVERPASVVKELVENSIDANSTIIEIEVEEAGLQRITITDNGDGIEAEDIRRAFDRHATSKIKNEQDLFRIHTLGFRGEALPSIASVSRLVIESSTGDGPGTKVELEGGKEIGSASSPARKGTEITVSDLFFNTPARLKYVKTIHTELGNISDVVNRLALAHPQIAFKLSHNGKTLLQTNGNGDVRAVLAAIYGFNLAKKMIPIRAESLDFSIEGYISYPESTRASRNYISLMVNGRYIKNYLLTKAIMDGYHTLLPVGRYPIVLLDIKMDPILVDVNVHPAKLEVRLSKEQELMELITATIIQEFKKKVLIPSNEQEKRVKAPKPEQVSFTLEHRTEPEEESPKESRVPLFNKEATVIMESTAAEDARPWNMPSSIPVQMPVQTDRKPENIDEDKESASVMEEIFIPDEEPADIPVADQMETAEEPERERTEAVSRIPTLYPIGQLHGTYILAQNEKGLYMIDQHAAQERIKYEFFREKVGEVTNDMQDLLVPITLQYSTDECIKIQENLHLLQEVGIYLEDFGHNAFIVRTHPQWFPSGDEQEMIESIIDQLLQMKKVDVKKLREEAAILMSCKASIKANHHLRNDEIFSLLNQLRNSSDPFTCPHGRPIIIHYSTYDIEKMFKRVM
ncbi:DNA mismatch repair endonuclease MutL [Bacillus testis]|uniref:DNA mismatch repair endonuclease MutL n=1 Tax=Bacillus testis TaxID=1622072 RepID=UPI00067EA4D8|nr:DNA mismatch repair endonuclease MutL [Bacillus testis]